MVSKNWSQQSRYFSGSSSVDVLLGKIVAKKLRIESLPQKALDRHQQAAGNDVFVNSLWHKIDERGIGCIDQTCLFISTWHEIYAAVSI